MDKCLLDILEKEREGLRIEKEFGNLVMMETSKEEPDEVIRQIFIMKRDEGLRMVNEARYELKSYLGYLGIWKR